LLLKRGIPFDPLMGTQFGEIAHGLAPSPGSSSRATRQGRIGSRQSFCSIEALLMTALGHPLPVPALRGNGSFTHFRTMELSTRTAESPFVDGGIG
jgi:hypothetical protein